jgi:hypothetical protein
MILTHTFRQSSQMNALYSPDGRGGAAIMRLAFFELFWQKEQNTSSIAFSEAGAVFSGGMFFFVAIMFLNYS